MAKATWGCQGPKHPIAGSGTVVGAVGLSFLPLLPPAGLTVGHPCPPSCITLLLTSNAMAFLHFLSEPSWEQCLFFLSATFKYLKRLNAAFFFLVCPTLRITGPRFLQPRPPQGGMEPCKGYQPQPAASAVPWQSHPFLTTLYEEIPGYAAS